MLLLDVFIGLFAQNIMLSFDSKFIKKKDLDEAIKKEVTAFRTLNTPSLIELYKFFVSYCKHAFLDVNQQPLFALLIDFLSLDELPLDERAACNKLNDIFHLNIKNQVDIHQIAAMGHSFIERPKAFASFIRYLVLRDMNPEQILSTHLLQNYFRYYLHTLKDENNAVIQLYRILNMFSETQVLCNYAQTIRCDEGGPIDGTVAIDGVHLVKIDLQSAPICYTSSVSTLNGLYNIFFMDFIFHGIFQKNNAICINFLHEICNQTDFIDTSLSILLNRVQEHPVMHETMAKLLNDETLQILVKKGVISFLFLIPYRPNIINLIQMHDLRHYLQMSEKSVSEIALLSNLFVLFNAVKFLNDTAAELVFDSILDATMNAPSYVFEDSLLISNFNGCSKDYFIQKIGSLEAQFDSVLAVQTQKSIEDIDFISIEDSCKSVARKIYNLQEIFNFDTTCPKDKYQLYKRIAGIYLAKANPLNLDALTQALRIEPYFEPNRVTVYERYLIELLCEIDNAAFRNQCIQLLEEAPRPWRSYIYAELSVFDRAALTGNLGLIKQLKKENTLSLIKYDTLAIDAADRNYWHLVTYYHQHHNLNKKTIKKLLKIAIKQLTSEFDAFLDCKHRPEQMLIMIEAEFLSAIRINNYIVVNWLLSCSKPPSDKCKANGLELAVKKNYVTIVKLLIAASNPSKHLKKAIEKAFMEAIRRDDSYETLQVLTLYSDLQLNENGLLAAQRANKLNIVKLLVQLPFKSPRLEIIERIYDYAKMKKQTPIINYLNDICQGIKPSSNNTQRSVRHSTTKNGALSRSSFFRFVNKASKHSDLTLPSVGGALDSSNDKSIKIAANSLML